MSPVVICSVAVSAFWEDVRIHTQKTELHLSLPARAARVLQVDLAALRCEVSIHVRFSRTGVTCHLYSHPEDEDELLEPDYPPGELEV